MKKKLLFAFLAASVCFSACQKESIPVPEKLTPAPSVSLVKNLTLKKTLGTKTLGITVVPIDTIYLCNTGPIYVNGTDSYDGMKIYHTHLSRNIVVTYVAVYGNQAYHQGPERVFLGTDPAGAAWDLMDVYYRFPAQHHASGSGYYTDTFSYTITSVKDENDTDIMSQVLIIPNGAVTGSARGIANYGSEEPKDGDGSGH